MVLAPVVEKKGSGALRAVEKLAERVDAVGSTQVNRRSDGYPSVMQGAAAVRETRRIEAPTTLETSAPFDHAANGLTERAVCLVRGVVRTFKNEMEYTCGPPLVSSSTPPH